MTQKQISNYFNIPFSTLSDWKNENNGKYKLYQFLKNLDEKEVLNISNKKNNHRFFHILNRNINNNQKFTFDDIKVAFKKRDYQTSTIKDKIIYLKFFKEIEPTELEEFITNFDISKRDIKSIYISSPFRNLLGVAKVWDKRFRLKHIISNKEVKKSIPVALEKLLNKKKLVYV